MAEKKKILYIVEAMGGGVFTYIVDLANELVNKYDMYIAYAVRKQTPKNYKDYFDKRIHLIEVKNFGRAINPTKDIAAFFEVKKIAAEVKPDVIHLHSSKAGAIGRVAFDPTMRGRVPSRCDFSNGMLYYEESFVEGIQTTNGISALQWLYIDKRMPIELSSNFLLMKSGNGISLHASYGEKKKTVDVYPKPSKISTVLKHQKALFQTLQIKFCLRSKTGKIDRWMMYIRSSI